MTNNPPEKLFIRLIHLDIGTASIIASLDREVLGVNDCIEYHLAQIWKDAVKDPPKEEGRFVAGWKDGTWSGEYAWSGTWFVRRTDGSGYVLAPTPDFYMVPEPPKEGE